MLDPYPLEMLGKSGSVKKKEREERLKENLGLQSEEREKRI